MIHSSQGPVLELCQWLPIGQDQCPPPLANYRPYSTPALQGIRYSLVLQALTSQSDTKMTNYLKNLIHLSHNPSLDSDVVGVVLLNSPISTLEACQKCFKPWNRKLLLCNEHVQPCFWKILQQPLTGKQEWCKNDLGKPSLKLMTSLLPCFQIYPPNFSGGRN